MINVKPRITRWRLLAFTVLAGILLWGIADPASLREAAFAVVSGYIEVAWVIVLGVLSAAGLRAAGLDAAIGRRLSGYPFRAVLAASVVGGVTPICGLTVMPLIAGLLGGGVGLAPVMAFWVSSPITDPAIFAVTAGMLGFPFAIFMLVASIGMGLAAGLVTSVLDRLGWLTAQLRAKTERGSAGGAKLPLDVDWRIWRDLRRRRLFREELVAALRLIGLWLTLAFVGEYWLSRLLPPDLVSSYTGSQNPFAVPAAVAVGAPIYVEAYAALPLLRGLLEMGMAPGAAMAFLIAGAAVSAFSAVAVLALVRWRTFVLYVALSMLGALAAGYGFEALVDP